VVVGDVRFAGDQLTIPTFETIYVQVHAWRTPFAWRWRYSVSCDQLDECLPHTTHVLHASICGLGGLRQCRVGMLRQVEAGCCGERVTFKLFWALDVARGDGRCRSNAATQHPCSGGEPPEHHGRQRGGAADRVSPSPRKRGTPCVHLDTNGFKGWKEYAMHASEHKWVQGLEGVHHACI
jgi:hypothetical protein